MSGLPFEAPALSEFQLKPLRAKKLRESKEENGHGHFHRDPDKPQTQPPSIIIPILIGLTTLIVWVFIISYFYFNTKLLGGNHDAPEGDSITDKVQSLLEKIVSPIQINEGDIPSPVTNAKATELNNTSATITWDNMKDSGGYDLMYQLAGDSMWQNYGILNSNTVTITSLIPGLSYSFRIYNMNGVGHSIPTICTLTMTPEIILSGKLPNIPTQLSINSSSIAVDRFTINWQSSIADDQFGQALQYVIYYRVSDNTQPTSSSYTLGSLYDGWIQSGYSLTTSFSVTQLESKTIYDVAIVSVNNYGSSSPNFAFQTQTLPSLNLGTIPGTVQNLRVTSSNVDNFVLNWNAPDTLQTYSYVVSYSATSLSLQHTYATTGNTNVQITGLQIGAYYDFKVAALNNAGSGNTATLTNIKVNSTSTIPVLTIPNTPTNPNITTFLSSNVPAVTLTFYGSNADRYLISYQVVGSSSNDWIYQPTTIPAPIDSSTQVSMTISSNLQSSASYIFRVQGVNGLGLGSALIFPTVQMLYSNPNGTIPNAPTNLNINIISTSELSLNWNGSGSAQQYEVEYQTLLSNGNTGPWIDVGVTLNTSVNITHLSGTTTYNFRVFSRNAWGQSNSYGSLTNITMPSENASGSSPSTISLPFTSTSTSSSITLNWAVATSISPPSSAGTIVYNVLYRVINPNDSNSISVINSSWTEAQGSLNTTSCQVTGLTFGLTYQFQVIAQNNYGQGLPSYLISGLTPPQPSGLYCDVTQTTISGLFLIWNSLANCDYFLVEQRISGTNTWINAGQTDNGNTFRFMINGLSSQWTQYDLRVTGYNTYGIGTPATLITSTTVGFPVWPLGSSVLCTNTTASSTTVTWTGILHVETVQIQYKLSTDADSQYQTFPIINDGTDFSNGTVILEGLNPGFGYNVRVNAFNKYGNAYLNVVSIVNTLPVKVTNFQANSSTSTGLTLQWNTSSGATYYLISYQVNGESTWTSIANQYTGTTMSFGLGTTISPLLIPGTIYLFRIQACNISGSSTSYTMISYGTLSIPPITLIQQSITESKLSIRWTASFGVTKGYIIAYKPTASGTWQYLTTDIGITSILDNLQSGTTYNVQIAAVNDYGGASIFSTPLNFTTITDGVTNLIQTNSTTSTSISITWSTVVGAVNGYQISSSLLKTSPVVVNSSTTSYVFDSTNSNGIQAGITGTISIIAINTNNVSSVSRSLIVGTLSATVSTFTCTSTDISNATLTWTTSTNATNYQLDWQEVDALNKTIWNGTTLVSGVTTSITLGSLPPGENIIFRIQTINNYGINSTVRTVTASTFPSRTISPTVGLIYANVTTNSTTLYWAGSQGAKTYMVQYRVYVSTGSPNTWNTFTSITAPVVNSIVSSLQSNVSYDFQVLALDSSSNSTLVGVVTNVLTKSLPSSSSITQISFTSVTAKSMIVNWSSVVDAIYYDLYFYNSSLATPSTPTISVEGSTNINYQFSDLLSAVKYSVFIIVRNYDGSSLPTSTFNQITAPNNATNFGPSSTISPSTSSVSLSWNFPVGNSNSTINLYGRNTTTDISATYYPLTVPSPTSATSITISKINNVNLVDGSGYDFRLVTTSLVGGTTVTNTIDQFCTVYTLPKPPTTFLSTPWTKNTLNLTWDSQIGALAYTISFLPTGSNNTMISYTYATTSTNNLMVNNLTPGTEYAFTITTIGLAGTSIPSLPLLVATSPIPPNTFGITAFTNNTITLTWSSANNGTTATNTYLVEFQPSGGSWSTITGTYITGNSVICTGLLGGTLYNFRIRTYYAHYFSLSDISTVISGTTLPNVPTGMVVDPTNITSSSAVMTWVAPTNGSVNHYSVYIQATAPTTDANPILYRTTSNLTMTVQGLKAGTNYNFSVSSNSSSGNSSLITLNVPTRPIPIKDLKTISYVADGTLSITLSCIAPVGAKNLAVWVSVSGGTFTQIVNFAPTNTSSPSSQTFTITSAILTSAGLAPMRNNTQYRFYISSLNSLGYFDAGYNIITTGLPPSRPLTLSIVPSSTAALLSWTYGTNDISNSGTVVRYLQVGGAQSNWITFGKSVANAPSTTITGLIPGTVYSFEILGTNDYGYGNALISTSTCTTNAANLSGLVAGTQITTNTIPIMWNPSQGAVSYTISYTPSGGSTSTVNTTNTDYRLTGLTTGKSYVISVVPNGPTSATNSTTGIAQSVTVSTL